MAPQDTGAVASTLDTLPARTFRWSAWTPGDKGKVFMVVRADNKAYGNQSLRVLAPSSPTRAPWWSTKAT